MKKTSIKNQKGRDSKGKFIPGFKHDEQTKLKIKSNNAKYWLGKKRPEVSEMSKRVNTGNKYNLGKKRSEEYKNRLKSIIGENHPHWIKDRSLLKKDNREGNPAYREWQKQVYKRDNYICKINNGDCKGRKEAHHILSWREFTELRYDINNGITLCVFHHPRKHEEEKRLSSHFKKLIKS